jgi:hypothetical protein
MSNVLKTACFRCGNLEINVDLLDDQKGYKAIIFMKADGSSIVERVPVKKTSCVRDAHKDFERAARSAIAQAVNKGELYSDDIEYNKAGYPRLR